MSAERPSGRPPDRDPDGPSRGSSDDSPWSRDPWSRERRRQLKAAAARDRAFARAQARFEHKRAHWAHRGLDRPDWWPPDEPWPPQREFPWGRARRRFLIRFAIGITLIFVLVILGPIFVIAQLLSLTGLQAPASDVAAVVVLLLLLLAVSGGARSARRFAGPMGDLIEAAGKVEAGDYTARVRVPRHGFREMRVLTSAFNSMTARLETDERQRRTLLADVSHELRTPLAVLRGELEAMIDGVHPTDEAHLAAAVDQIEMLTGLVEDLRTLALAEGGNLELRPEPTDVAVLVAEVAAAFDGLASTAGVRIVADMPDDLPLVELDPLRIRQVLSNLVANALRYAPRGSEVTMSARAEPRDRLTISVVDRGPGIPPELRDRLFERFTRSEDSRGSGLGLAIARRLVEGHGGTIRLESPPEGGTAIVLELPRASR